MHKIRALWIGLLWLATLCPAAKAQNQRTVSELIESIKAQKEREFESVLTSPTPLSSPPRTQPTPRSPAPMPAPVGRPTRSAPVRQPEATVALPSRPPVAQQSLAPVGPAAIQPELWPQVLSLSGINAHYSSELMIDRRVYLVDGQELPRDLDGWLILSISERGVCISREGGSRCLHPPGSTRMTISSARSPQPPSMTGSERLDPGVRP